MRARHARAARALPVFPPHRPYQRHADSLCWRRHRGVGPRDPWIC